MEKMTLLSTIFGKKWCLMEKMMCILAKVSISDFLNTILRMLIVTKLDLETQSSSKATIIYQALLPKCPPHKSMSTLLQHDSFAKMHPLLITCGGPLSPFT